MTRGDTRRYHLYEAGGLLPNHIYIQTQLFGISILDLFWRGFGEVLERDFGEQKLQKHCVLQWFLIATIKKPLVFLGFSCFGEVSGSSKVTKTLCFTMFFNSDHWKTIVFL